MIVNPSNRNSLNPRSRFEAAAVLLGTHSHQCPGCKDHYGCTRKSCRRDDRTDRYPDEPCRNCADPLMIRTDQGGWYDLRYVRLKPDGVRITVWHNNKPVRLGWITRAADRRKCEEFGL